MTTTTTSSTEVVGIKYFSHRPRSVRAKKSSKSGRKIRFLRPACFLRTEKLGKTAHVIFYLFIAVT